jgi:hypothetical protein
MKLLLAVFVLSLSASFPVALVCGQEPAAISLASEPHHHLALHNEYVNVYEVKVAPGDSVRLHRHDTDAISMSLSESLVTVHSPGRPDVRQKLAHGQIRLQAQGFVHSTVVEGDTPFRNVTVELLLPQTGKQNRCAQVIAGQPLNCATAGQGVAGSAGHDEQPQFETEQTSVILVRLAPHGRVGLTDLGGAELMIAIDAGIAQAGGNGTEKQLNSGDSAWLDSGDTARVFKNDSERETRFVYFVFKPKR